jgi:hypothetical protein
MSSLTVHLYALCWNEEPHIPYFFRHYDTFVSEYFIYDDGSNDNSVALLKAHPRTHVTHVKVRKEQGIAREDETTFQAFYAGIWKQSIGRADFVILCNIDEHFYHPDMLNYLERNKNNGVTIIPSVGFDMVSWTFPRSGLPLSSLVKFGYPNPMFNKTFAFNPNKIKESGFGNDRHNMQPIGEIRYPMCLEVKLLHYHCIGFLFMLRRRREKGQRLKSIFRLYYFLTTSVCLSTGFFMRNHFKSKKII